jgi:hypothetical protein
MLILEANRVTLMRLETAEITDGQRDRRPSNERREESAFDRFKARPSDRSGMRAGDFAAGKMNTASCIRTTPGPTSHQPSCARESTGR